MGLDTVELVLAVEEEFGVSVPDQEAEEIKTVGEIFEWLKPKVVAYETSDNKVCLSQHLFYKLRQALVKNYNLPRGKIKPDTRLSDLISLNEIESGWPYVQLHSDFKVPAFRSANEFLGFRLSQDSLTMKELIEAMIMLNGKDFVVMKDTEEEVWRRLVKIFEEQFNIPRHEIREEARIVQDLGLD